MNAPPQESTDRNRSGPSGGNFVGLWLAALLLTGCTGIRTPGEKHARQDLKTVGDVYRPQHERPTLPALRVEGGLGEFLQFAILNQQQVEAAYYDWAAAVQRITVERSLPDPKLTFSTDIASMVMSLMPGLMMDFPGPGKRGAAAGVATAESEVKYFAFEASVLQAAFVFKKAYYELHFIEGKIRVNRETLRLVSDVERLARAQNEVGKVTLQDVLRAQIEQERLTTEIANLEDSRNPMLAQFRAALGLKATDAAPPIPQKYESTPLDLTSESLFATALAQNPRLKAMEAEVRRADASLRLAYKARVPDFSVGIEVDVKASPLMVSPQVGLTLPIWRDKTLAQIAGAQANKQAAEARLSAEEIALAVEFAEKSFLFREASRGLELLTVRLLPKAQQSLEVARSGYVSGKVDFLNLLDAERTLLEFQFSEIDARVQRELALAELSLLVLGTPPANAPLLSSAGDREKEKS
ncbi:MAG: TolC family protein [Opitutaceae bacterium]